MAMVIVIMLNILIAQMSYTYGEAKRTAKLQYAVDTMLIITRLEYSRFARWVSMVLSSFRKIPKYPDDVNKKEQKLRNNTKPKDNKTQRIVTLLSPAANWSKSSKYFSVAFVFN